jgi:hypothetical protein
LIAGLAILASLLADAFIFATIAELIAAGYAPSDPDAFGAWSFCIVAVAGYGLPRLVEGFELTSRKAYILTALGGLGLIYLLVRVQSAGDVAVWDFAWAGNFLTETSQTTEQGGHALTGSILLLATWARATLRSGDEIEMEAIPRSFAIPFAVVTTVVVVGAATDRSGEVGRAGAAFYVMAILSLVSAQLSLSGATFGELRAGSTAGILLAGTAAVATVGLSVIGIFTAFVGPIIGPIIGSAVEWTLTIILTPFAWLLEKFFAAMFGDANPFPQLGEGVSDLSREAANPDDADKPPASRTGVFILRTFALLVFLAVAGLLVSVFLRLRKRAAVRLDDDRQAAAVGDLRQDVGAFFRSLFRRGGHREPGYATTEATRLYLEVLERAERAGHSRPDGETAREFAPELRTTFASPVTDDITRAFEAARYAGREPDVRTIEDLRRRWQHEANEPQP